MTDLPTLHEVTPLWHSLPLSATAGRPVYLKVEALQPAGSFKIRGVGRLCAHSVAQGARWLVSSSGGSAGVAVAYAARALGVRATVFMFDGVPATARQRVAELGAEVVIAGATWDAAHARASEAANTPTAAYIHPFDHPEIWRGNSTLVDEIVAAGRRPDLVVLSVGGGGLLTGVLQGLERHQLTDTRVLAVETTGTASLHAALAAGHLVRLARIDSVAKTLGAAQVAAEAFAQAQRHGVCSRVVTDQQALTACRQFALDHRLLVEPATGAALAALTAAPDVVSTAREIAVVVCGGVGIVLRDEIFDYTR